MTPEQQSIRALEAQVRELQQALQRAGVSADNRMATERSPYVLSTSDKERAQDARTRAQGFTQATGPRPIGGGTAGIGDINASATVGLAKDSVSGFNNRGPRGNTGPEGPPGPGLPTGSTGDMVYHNGTDWVLLENPGAPTGGNWVLRHNGTAPYWDSQIPTDITDIQDRLDNASASADLTLDCSATPPTITGDITITI